MDLPADAPTARSRLYPALPATARRLRVVALVSGVNAPSWIAETLCAVVDSDVAELLSVAAVTVPPPRHLPRLLELFLHADAWLAGIARMATARCSLPGRLPQTVFGACSAVQTEPRLELSDEDLQRLAASEPDLIVSFGLPPAGSRLGAIARHGVWTFERYAADALRCALWLLDPVMRGDPVTRSGLVLHMSDLDEWCLLRPLRSATSQLSFSRNRANQLLRTPALLVRSLRELAQGRQPARHPAPCFEPPGALAMLLFGPRFVLRAMRRQLPRLGRVESWFLALRRGPQLDPAAPRFEAFRRIDAPPGRFWADPCAVRHDGRDYVFVEDYLYATRRGRIAAVELDGELRAVRSSVVLETPWHLSYPCLFEWDGDTYMTVESSESQRVTLYRARRFPDRWQLVAHLLHGWNIVDPTLHFDGTRWYLFATVKESALSYDDRIWDDLFLFWAPTPLGPWRPHPKNPIVSDVRAARPAGRLFVHEGRLIRPSQDCSVDYGYAVVFNEVTELDTERYEERRVGRLDPAWDAHLKGCHTYSNAAGLEVLDAKILVGRRPEHEPQSAAPAASKKRTSENTR